MKWQYFQILATKLYSQVACGWPESFYQKNWKHSKPRDTSQTLAQSFKPQKSTPENIYSGEMQI